ncbi:MAG: hypothetical protein IJS14_07960 [Lentisphaeria bacterium]|nr:hypothetical protein [Lentisphaeria bacterium]
MHWINIVPLFPKRIDDMIEKAVRIAKETHFTDFAVSLSIHAEGTRAMNKIEYLAPLFTQYREGLAKHGLNAGILFQSTVGHAAVSCRSPLPYQHSVLNNGNETRWCMLDPDYRKYICDAIQMLVRTKPAFTLIDDDFRMNHGEASAECFCPRHTEMFNRLNGTNYTPEEFREAFNRSELDSPFRKAIREMQLKTLLETAAVIRKAIDEVSPDTRAILCLCGGTSSDGELSKTFAGKTMPGVRLSNSMYLEPDMKLLTARMLKTQYSRSVLRDIPEALDESDTCPHNRFSKCVASLNAHLTGAILNGCTGGKLWLTPTAYWEDTLDKPYYALFARKHDFYDELERTMKEAEPAGVNNAVNEGRMIYEPSWTSNALGLFGVPVCSIPQKRTGIQTIAGARVAENLSDAEMESLLAGKLLLDGPAAEVFTRRGFAKDLGVRVVKEVYTFGEIDENGVSLNSIWNRFPTVRIYDPDPKAEIVSKLVKADYFKSPNVKDVAPGSTVFHNSRGGTVAVTARCVDLKSLQIYMLTPVIKDFLVRLLQRIDQDSFHFVIAEDQEFFAQEFRLKSGEYLLSAFNLSYDPVETLRIRTSLPVAGVKQLKDSGKWEEIPFTCQDGILSVPTPLAAYQPVILRIAAQ